MAEPSLPQPDPHCVPLAGFLVRIGAAAVLIRTDLQTAMIPVVLALGALTVRVRRG